MFHDPTFHTEYLFLALQRAGVVTTREVCKFSAGERAKDVLSGAIRRRHVLKLISILEYNATAPLAGRYRKHFSLHPETTLRKVWTHTQTHTHTHTHTLPSIIPGWLTFHMFSKTRENLAACWSVMYVYRDTNLMNTKHLDLSVMGK